MIKEIKEFNVDYIEFVDEGLHKLNLKRIKILKKISEEMGVKTSVHAPFADVNIASPVKIFRRKILERLKKSIMYASQLESEIWIFHPGLKTGLSMFYPSLDWKINLDSVRILAEYAESMDIKIAIENMPKNVPAVLKNPEDFAEFFKELDLDVGFVLDVGHAHMSGSIMEFLKKLKDKLTYMHIHDNNGKIDSHMAIGTGTIDWDNVVKAIMQIKYDGIITLEVIEDVRESIVKFRKLISRHV